MSKINVRGTDITIVQHGNQDYICLTDMVRNQEGDQHIRNWLRNKNTLEYIGLWEVMSNPSFKLTEFDGFKSKAGLNRFTISPKQWIEATDAIGIVSKSGKYGGTYARTGLRKINNGLYKRNVH